MSPPSHDLLWRIRVIDLEDAQSLGRDIGSQSPKLYLPLAGEASNRSVGKKFTPARIVSKGGKSVVAEVPSNGSGDFISALRAEGVFEIPAGVPRLAPGDLVGFHPVWGDLFREEG